MSEYSIWVLEYSYVKNYHVSGVIYGAHNEGYRKLPYCYVLIKGNGHVAMVDVGYNNRDYGAVMATNFGVEHWHSPTEVLASCGVTPADVQTVFITHAHFDHLGGTDDFPNATFYIQEQELSKWVWAMSLPPQFKWLMVATDPADIMRTVELARQGRLRLINGDRADVLPNIDVYAAMDTHTWGCMYVVVRNDGKSESDDAWILAGDLVYCFENLRGRVAGEVSYLPVGMATGSQTNLLLATDKMLDLVGRESKRVIPIHEEGLRDVFPSRITEAGLRITELCLADGEPSRVNSVQTERSRSYA